MICRGCNYPIPSWQHNGACKPVAEKVPVITNLVARAIADSYSARVTEIRTETVTKRTETVTPEDETVTRANKRYGNAADRQRAYRERKKQG